MDRRKKFSTRQRLALAEAVSVSEPWMAIAKLCGRSESECKAEFRDMVAEQGKNVPPARVLEAARQKRIELLRKKILRREQLMREINGILEAPHESKELMRLIDCIAEDADTAKYKSGVLERRLREQFEDDEDEPEFLGRETKKPKVLPPPHEKKPEAFHFSGKLALELPIEIIVRTSRLANGTGGMREETSMRHLLSVFEKISSCRAAALFQDPVTDRVAPGYSSVVKNPMCLSTIRSSLYNGSITTIYEFYRDLMLMLTNAFIFNTAESEVFKEAEVLRDVVKKECEPLLLVQKLGKSEHKTPHC